MKNKMGKLITFSGIDGSGKSTLCEKIFRYYNERCPSAMLSGFGNRIFTNELEIIAQDLQSTKNEVFSDYICNIAWLCDLSYTGINLISPLLKSGKNVFVDRYCLCAKVYSMATTTQHIEELFELYTCLPVPDICIYLSIDPCESMKRILNRDKKRAYYETENYLKKIKATYDEFIPKENYRIEIIDASQPLENLFKESIGLIDQLNLN